MKSKNYRNNLLSKGILVVGGPSLQMIYSEHFSLQTKTHKSLKHKQKWKNNVRINIRIDI